MLIARDSRVYYGIAVILLLNIVTNTNIFPKKRYLLKGNISITCYGVVAAISVFLFLTNLAICNTSLKRFAMVLVLFFAIMYTQCQTCGQSYQYVAVYRYFIPLLPFFFGCRDIKAILIAIAISSAIGRIGCMAAGCCNGPLTNHTNGIYYIEYPDPDQIVNKQNGLKRSKAISTIMLEAIIQFVMAGVMLTMPQHAIPIYIFGSGLLMYLSSVWREREHNKLTYLGLLVPLIICWGDKSVPICNGTPNYLVYGVVSVIIGLIYSNDINLEKIKAHMGLKNHN